MKEIPSFNSYIEQSIIDNWDKDALTDFKGTTLQYHDVARKIEKLHIMFEKSGVVPGEKIALCGRNSSHWAVAFLAVISYGAVAVPIQHEFTADQIHNIVNHSDARLLFAGDVVATSISFDAMPGLEGVIYLPDFSVSASRSEQLSYAREHLNEMFGQRYPKYFRKEHVSYHKESSPDELAIINYTSGTTGFSKGVMLPYRALWGNLDHLQHTLAPHIRKGSSMVCTLPMAHMYGMMVEFLFGFVNGMHLYYLTRVPSPSLIAEAFAQVHPALVVAVPLVIEKIVRKKIFPLIQGNRTRLLLNMPVISKKVKQQIRNMVADVFGGNAYEIITGGAALNQEIEAFFNYIDFPITVAYGATETAPLITFNDHSNYQHASCGNVVTHMELRIDSTDPANVPGEILTRGTNKMLGYYKNDEATAQAIDKDGWYHTGDLGTMSADGHVFIKGRIKNMLLGSNGQNVYPEEIEDKLNSMAMVSESLILQKGDKLVALVHPDGDEAKAMGFGDDDLQTIMEQNRQQLNQSLPPFCKISEIRLHHEEFIKTPKKSIKRYLYQDAV